MSIAGGNFGSGDHGYIEIDGVAYPLAQGALVQRNPLNPFSPSDQQGNSSRITSQRHAVRVWDNFSGGAGFRDSTGADATTYAEGNLDTRNDKGVQLPLNTGTAFAAPGFAFSDRPVHVERMEGALSTISALFSWSANTSRCVVMTSAGVATVRPAERVYGFSPYGINYYYIAQVGFDTKVYRTADAGVTWGLATTLVAKACRGLVYYDGKLITYDSTNNLFLQTLDGVTWTTLFGGFTVVTNWEEVQQLLVWTDKSGSTDALYCLTNTRLMLYDEAGQQWEDVYSFLGMYLGRNAIARVHRRDNSLFLAPTDLPTAANVDTHGQLFVLNPGNADSAAINKGMGLATTEVLGYAHLATSNHWLYAWALGTPGAVWALNEFAGWTKIMDPAVYAPTKTLIGGGYANGVLYSVLSDGSMWQQLVPDQQFLHPRPSKTYEAGDHYLRSSWDFLSQLNRYKIGSHFEIDFRVYDGTSGVPSDATLSLKYRVDNGAWQTLTLNPAGNWPQVVTLPLGAGQTGVGFKRLQWELHAAAGASGVTPVLASVALYYTYWQENHYAYQFTVDLSPESWTSEDGGVVTFAGKTREALVQSLLALNDTKGYHTLTYVQLGGLVETVNAIDILVNGREDAERGGGVYGVTCRDLEPDA